MLTCAPEKAMFGGYGKTLKQIKYTAIYTEKYERA